MYELKKYEKNIFFTAVIKKCSLPKTQSLMENSISQTPLRLNVHYNLL